MAEQLRTQTWAGVSRHKNNTILLLNDPINTADPKDLATQWKKMATKFESLIAGEKRKGRPSFLPR